LTYCDARRLSVTARRELFVAVCQAVQRVHKKGVIHRDLKPGKLLVTEVDGRPTPKAIDFGVDKAADFKLGVPGTRYLIWWTHTGLSQALGGALPLFLGSVDTIPNTRR
jgi:serine/threonine protein kinase